MKKLLLIVALAVSANAWAEAKQIICESPKDMETRIKGWEYRMKTCGPGSEELELNAKLYGKDYCANDLKAMPREKKECEEADYNLRKTFVINTNDLSKNEAFAEASSKVCYTGKLDDDVKRIKYVISTSTLSFYLPYINSYIGQRIVHVNRKTLKAFEAKKGLEITPEHTFTCRIEDVDTSENQI